MILGHPLLLNLIFSLGSILIFNLITNSLFLTFMFSFFPPIWVYQGAKIANEPLTVFLLLLSLYLWLKQKEFLSGLVCGLSVTVRLISVCLGLAILATKLSRKFFLGLILGSSLLFVFNYFKFGPENLFIQFEVNPKIGGAAGSGIGITQIFQDIFRTLDWHQYRIFSSGLFYLFISFLALIRLRTINKLYFYWLLFSLLFIFSLSPVPLLEEYGRFLVPVVPAIIISMFSYANKK